MRYLVIDRSAEHLKIFCITADEDIPLYDLKLNILEENREDLERYWSGKIEKMAHEDDMIEIISLDHLDHGWRRNFWDYKLTL